MPVMAYAIAASWLLHAPPPSPETPIPVTLEACGGLDGRAVELHLARELARAAASRAVPPMRAVVVSIRCLPRLSEIAVQDSVTGKEVRRAVPLVEADDPEGARVLAVAAFQLLVASWLELLVVPEPPSVEPTPERAPTPVPQTERRFATVVADRAVRSVRGPEPFQLGGGARLHRFAQHGPLVAGRATLRAGHWWRRIRLQLFGELGFSAAVAERRLGRVDAYAIDLGPGLAFRTRTRGRVTFDAALVVALVWIELVGRSRERGVETDRAYGLGAAASVSFGPCFHLGWARLQLAVEAGWLGPGPAAGVRGEAPVRLHGEWLGVSLRLGVGP